VPVLAALLPDPLSRARLQDALGAPHEIVQVDDWTHLWEVVHRRRLDACVVDIYRDAEGATWRELRRLRRRRRPMALVVYSDFSGRELDLFELGRRGVDGVLLAGAGDSRSTVRDTVGHSLGRALGKRIAEAVEGRLPPLGCDALRWSIEHAHRSPDPDALAAGLSMSSPRLARRLRGMELPAPGHMLCWGRLFRGAAMLDSDERTVESVAWVLGYASATSLARAFRRETGLPPTEVVRRGGIACVLDRFLSRCRSRRRSDTVPMELERRP